MTGLTGGFQLELIPLRDLCLLADCFQSQVGKSGVDPPNNHIHLQATASWSKPVVVTLSLQEVLYFQSLRCEF